MGENGEAVLKSPKVRPTW